MKMTTLKSVILFNTQRYLWTRQFNTIARLPSHCIVKFDIYIVIWNLRAHIEKSALIDLRFTRIIATALQSIVGVPECDGMLLHGFSLRFLRMWLVWPKVMDN